MTTSIGGLQWVRPLWPRNIPLEVEMVAIDSHIGLMFGRRVSPWLHIAHMVPVPMVGYVLSHSVLHAKLWWSLTTTTTIEDFGDPCGGC